MNRPVTRTARCVYVGLVIAGLARAPLAGAPGPTRPEFVTPASQSAVEKGINYLVRSQRADGSWRSAGLRGSYPAAMTSLAGLALMAGGSTAEDGPHARQVKKAMLYILRLAKGKSSGLIAQGGQSMYGHGFSMLFLAQCYGVESSTRYGREIRDALHKAVALTVKAQSRKGGWIYTPDGGGDEGSVTVTQLQALRACRNVGIKVPRETIAKAVKYLKDCQNADGGISYSYRNRGSSRPAISAAAIACFYAAGAYDRQSAQGAREAETVEKLVKYCRKNLSVKSAGGHYFYAHFYMAQAMYQRGGKDYRRYIPTIRDRLVAIQHADGSWMGDGVGTTYGTALACTILQLPYGYLPIYER